MTTNRYAEPLLSLPRPLKRIIALTVDASFCILSVWFAYCLRMDDWIVLDRYGWFAVAISLVLAIPLFIVLGLYRAIFRYAGLPAFLVVVKALTIYSIAYITIFTAISVPGVPRTVGIIQPLLLLVAVMVPRLVARSWLGGAYQKELRRNARAPILIYGAGQSGRQLAGALATSLELRVVGYLDDDRRLQGNLLNGVPIHDPADLADLAERAGIRDVLLALPSITRQRRNEILDAMRRAKVNVRSMPDLTDMAQGRVAINDLKELDIDDLLGRGVVDPDPELLARNIRGKTVLVTGAGGSIGSELCRQILRHQPKRLALVEQNEYGLYAIHGELGLRPEVMNGGVQLLPFLASVRDEFRMRQVIDAVRPETLYHAAAYKHVPLVEFNSAEGLRNNVFGTLTTARIAQDAGVRNFVLISTDKAVRPTNVMGASKRLAEMVLQGLAHEARDGRRQTVFSMVRFGNVLGSSGSVVPLFRQQIRDGGPITLTHPEITRYFMSIPEASQLVIQAGAMASGGDVFLLDMGEPVKIIDLARRMVELSGLTLRDETNPEGDIAIAITGLRPGEKLYEELLIGENPLPTQHPRIMRANEVFLPLSDLLTKLSALETALLRCDFGSARTLLETLVSGYTPESGIVDLLAGTQEAMAPGPGTSRLH